VRRHPCCAQALQKDGTALSGRCAQPAARPSFGQRASALADAPVSTAEEPSTSAHVCEAVDLEDILKERDACGVGHVFHWAPLPSVHSSSEVSPLLFGVQVGFIANLKNRRSHIIVEQVRHCHNGPMASGIPLHVALCVPLVASHSSDLTKIKLVE
jgi:hypothetical protein